MTLRLACAVGLSGLLAGCASLAPPEAPPAPATAEVARPRFATIELGGRLSAQYSRNGMAESLHGSFTWAQTPERTELTLLSPLGQILAVIDVRPGIATLTQAGQPARVATDPDGLAQAALGWPLPVAGLRDWLQGFALDDQGRLRPVPAIPGSAVTTPDGWQITYTSWHQGSPGTAARPRRIDLARQTVEAGPVSLRILIDNWQAP